MTTPDFLVLALATAYCAHVIAHTDGPFAVFKRAREQLPLGGLTACVYCLAPWCALALWLVLRTPFEEVVWILAAGGLALGFLGWTGMKHL